MLIFAVFVGLGVEDGHVPALWLLLKDSAPSTSHGLLYGEALSPLGDAVAQILTESLILFLLP